MGFNLCWGCYTPFNPAAADRFCDPECRTQWWEAPVSDLAEGDHLLLGIGRLTIPAAEITSDRWGAVTLIGEHGERLALEPGMTGQRGALRARVLDGPAPQQRVPERATTSAWRVPEPGDVIELGHGVVFTEGETGGSAATAIGVRPSWTNPRLGWLREAPTLRLAGLRVALELHAPDRPGLHAVVPENHAEAPQPANGTAETIPAWRADYRVRVAALLESLAAEYLHWPGLDQDGETFTIRDDTSVVSIAAPSDEAYRRLMGGGDLDDLAGAVTAAFDGTGEARSVRLQAVCGDTRFRLVWTASAERPETTWEDWPVPSGRFPDYLEALAARRPKHRDAGVPQHLAVARGLEQTLTRLVQAIPAGRWTSFGDLAKAAGGYHQKEVVTLLDRNEVPGRHRVLMVSGRPRRKGWGTASPDDLIARLCGEGVHFSSAGVAAPTQRMFPDELRAATRGKRRRTRSTHAEH